jgi:hypothetical protein
MIFSAGEAEWRSFIRYAGVGPEIAVAEVVAIVMAVDRTGP